MVLLSSCHGGQAIDKVIAKNNGFYDLERDDLVMVDRGFRI